MLRLFILLLSFISVGFPSGAAPETNYSYTPNRPLVTIGTKLENLTFCPNLKEIDLSKEQRQQLADLIACALMDRDPQMARQAREAFGEQVLPINGEPGSDYFAGSAIVRNLGIEEMPEQYFAMHRLPAPKVKTHKEMYLHIAKHFRETINEKYNIAHAEERAEEAARKALKKKRAEELAANEKEAEDYRETVRIRSLWGVGIASAVIMLCFCKECKSWRAPKWATAFVTSLLLIATYSGTGGSAWSQWSGYYLPYGFFLFLRISVSAICFWFAAMAADQKKHPLLFLSPVALFMLYQPFIMIELERATWFWFNIATIPVLMFLSYSLEDEYN